MEAGRGRPLGRNGYAACIIHRIKPCLSLKDVWFTSGRELMSLMRSSAIRLLA
jgi:hypothetical protein